MNVFSGTPRALGRQHGEELREEIRHVLGWYTDQWWGASAQELQDAVREHALAIQTHAAHLSDEMAGIAEGAGLEPWQIHALNARTELRANTEALECTSAGIPSTHTSTSGALLAQNWDWWNALRGWTRCVRLEPESGPAIVTLIEPGMVAKMGMNTHGVGLCLNFLSTPRVDLGGLPVHVLCRLALESRSAARAVALLTRARRAACANYIVGDAGGVVASVEVTPDAHEVFDGGAFVTATNTPQRGRFCMRRTIFDRRLRMRGNNLNTNNIFDSLGHLGVAALPSDELAVETIHTLVMDLGAGTLTLTDGSRETTRDEIVVSTRPHEP